MMEIDRWDYWVFVSLKPSKVEVSGEGSASVVPTVGCASTKGG